MCVCLPVFVLSWLIALQAVEAPSGSFPTSSPHGSPELVVQLDGRQGDFHEIRSQTVPTTEGEYV